MDALVAVLWLTLNVYYEARGEEQLAQMAVAHVTLNRAREQGKPIKDVVLQPYQFSWTLEPRVINDFPALVDCFNSAITAVNGRDFTRGATHYHERKVKPYWRKHMTYVGEFGNHKFYRRKQ